MFGLGMGELALVLLVAFLVLGPTQVPKLMRDLGKTIRDLRRAGEDVKQQLVLDDEIRKPFEELREAMSIPIDALDARDEADGERPAPLDQPMRKPDAQASGQALPSDTAADTSAQAGHMAGPTLDPTPGPLASATVESEGAPSAGTAEEVEAEEVARSGHSPAANVPGPKQKS